MSPVTGSDDYTFLTVTMHGNTSLQVFISLLAVLVSSAIVPVAARCPDNVWDKPVDLCSLPMELIRPVIQNHSIPLDIRINKTCESWMESDNCFETLHQKCLLNKSSLAEIEIFRKRYHHFSLPCYDEDFRYRQRLVDCLLPYIKTTNKCLGAFDKTYRAYVLDEEYSKACRMVATVMRCLDDIKAKVGKECSEEGAQEYNRNFIESIVVQIRPIVSKRCDTNSGADYMEYFGAASTLNFQMGVQYFKLSTVIIAQVCLNFMLLR